jgi:predicted peptidase
VQTTIPSITGEGAGGADWLRRSLYRMRGTVWQTKRAYGDFLAGGRIRVNGRADAMSQVPFPKATALAENLAGHYFMHPADLNTLKNQKKMTPLGNAMKRLRWPLVVFLHGGGHYEADAKKKGKSGRPDMNWPPTWWDGVDHPFLIVAPHAVNDFSGKKQFNGWAGVENAIDAIIADVRGTLSNHLGAPALQKVLGAEGEEIRWENQPVFLTGQSFGGGGAWALAGCKTRVQWKGLCLVCPKVHLWEDAPRANLKQLLQRQAQSINTDVILYHDVDDSIADISQNSAMLIEALVEARVKAKSELKLQAEFVYSPDRDDLLRIPGRAYLGKEIRLSRHGYDSKQNAHSCWRLAYTSGPDRQARTVAQDLYTWMRQRCKP